MCVCPNMDASNLNRFETNFAWRFRMSQGKIWTGQLSISPEGSKPCFRCDETCIEATFMARLQPNTTGRGLWESNFLFHQRGQNPEVETCFWWVKPVLWPHFKSTHSTIFDTHVQKYLYGEMIWYYPLQTPFPVVQYPFLVGQTCIEATFMNRFEPNLTWVSEFYGKRNVNYLISQEHPIWLDFDIPHQRSWRIGLYLEATLEVHVHWLNNRAFICAVNSRPARVPKVAHRHIKMTGKYRYM
jgi:hypothetical protein